jgi:serine phosphatase RsbU (regulator of sigma subunit)
LTYDSYCITFTNGKGFTMNFLIRAVPFILLFLFWGGAFPIYAQKQGQDRVDSLYECLHKQVKEDTSTVNLLTELAFELESTDPAKGLEYADQAHQLAVKLNYQAGIGKALLSKAVCYNTKSENAKALHLLFQALRILQDAGNFDEVATVYLNIGNIYFNESDFDRTLYYYNQALKVLEENENYSRCASVYGNIGNVYYIQSNYPKSLEYQFKSLALAEKSGNLRVQGNALVGIGNIYSKLPDYPKSLEYYFRSLKIFETTGNKKGMASSYGNIGIVYYRQSDYLKATENFLKARTFCEMIGDARGCAITYTNLGNVYADQDNYKLALESHSNANVLFEKINNKVGMASALGNIGFSHTQLGNYTQALHYYQEALKLNHLLDIKSGTLYNLKGLGSLYLKMALDSGKRSPGEKIPNISTQNVNNLQNAIKYSEMALSLGKESGELAPLVDAYNIISRSYQALNNWKQAFLYSDSANVLQDSLFSQENKMKISQIENERNNEIKKKEIQLFALNIKHQRNAIVAISCGLILMVVIASLIYRSLRIKKRNNLILEEKNLLITDQKEKIEETQMKIQSDIDKAKDYILYLLPAKIDDQYISTDWVFIPSSELGGDAFGYYWVDHDHFIFYILDTCGHGIGCALHSISVLNMLKSYVQRHVLLNNPEEVITSLNESFLMEDHSDLFFSMWYGVYHRDSGELKYVCAGHPFPLIINHQSHISVTAKANVPIGWFSGYQYSSESIKIEPGTRIYLFSDGAYELLKDNNEIMNLKEFYDFLLKENDDKNQELSGLIKKLQQIQEREEFLDDLSLVRIDFK